jgi:hypothetical protein
MKKYILIAECSGNTLYYYGNEDINTFEDENTTFD